MPRILILSDIHLGLDEFPSFRPARTAESLAPLIAETDQLVLNGDTSQPHHVHRSGASSRLLDDLLDRASRERVCVVLINGNHDFSPSQPDFLELFEGAIFVTHGHAFGDSMIPWTHAHSVVMRELAIARARNPETMEGILRAAGEASMAQWSASAPFREPTSLLSIGFNPVRVARVLSWWRTYPRKAAEFLDRFRRDCQILVCGHSHRSGSWHVAATKGGTPHHVLNTGSFMFPSSPRAVCVDSTATDVAVELRAIIGVSGRYALAPRSPASCWRIQRPTSATR